MRVCEIRSLDDFIEIFPSMDDLTVMKIYTEILRLKDVHNREEKFDYLFELLLDIENFISGYLARLCCIEIGNIEEEKLY